MAEGTQRRLAAIMSVDVVGYSRLMGADEAGTLAAMRSHRAELWNPTIEKFGGRVVGTAGDSLLVEFASAVAALETSIVVQRAMVERNADLPDNKRMLLRIGINIGEVVIEGDDIFGDGVNIAARMQEIAAQGGIAISRNVQEQVRDKLDIALVDDGSHQVKNIAEPVHVWRWSPAGVTRDVVAVEPLALPDKPSIAVLPFDNMSGDPEQEYFADGIAEDIITDLSKIPDLFVIARNSAFSYKGKSFNVPDVCRELGVHFALEGSIRKAGNRVRITAQLVDGVTGGHLWAERYDRGLEDIFAVQDEVVEKIVAALATQIAADEPPPDRQIPASVAAYDYLLKAREQIALHTKEANANAVHLLKTVIELDPEYAPAYAHLAETFLQQVQLSLTDDRNGALTRAGELAARAVALDDRSPLAHGALGQAYQWQKQHDKALAAARRRVALDSGDAEGLATYGMALQFDGQHEEAIAVAEKAIRLNPHYPFWYMFVICLAQYQLRRYDDALNAAQRCVFRNAESMPVYCCLAAGHAQLGQTDDARAAVAKSLELNADLTLSEIAGLVPYRRREDLDHYLDGLRKAGLPEN